MISLPENPESFQCLLLDLYLVCSKQLIISLQVIGLLLCQFLLRLYLATFLQYCFWAFFVVS
jgi:hypothetical protein